MKLFLGGIIGAVLGFVCLFYWWGAFIIIVKALFTMFVIGASALALFLGYEEIRANIKAEQLAIKSENKGNSDKTT